MCADSMSMNRSAPSTSPYRNSRPIARRAGSIQEPQLAVQRHAARWGNADCRSDHHLAVDIDAVRGVQADLRHYQSIAHKDSVTGRRAFIVDGRRADDEMLAGCHGFVVDEEVVQAPAAGKADIIGAVQYAAGALENAAGVV